MYTGLQPKVNKDVPAATRYLKSVVCIPWYIQHLHEKLQNIYFFKKDSSDIDKEERGVKGSGVSMLETEVVFPCLEMMFLNMFSSVVF